MQREVQGALVFQVPVESLAFYHTDNKTWALLSDQGGPTGSVSPVLIPSACSISATLVFLPSHSHSEHVPASGPLHLVFLRPAPLPPPRMLSEPISSPKVWVLAEMSSPRSGLSWPPKSNPAPTRPSLPTPLPAAALKFCLSGTLAVSLPAASPAGGAVLGTQ